MSPRSAPVPSRADPDRLNPTRVAVGWREWVALPLLGASPIRAKIDSGADTSALHATEIEAFRHADEAWVRFRMPDQGDEAGPVVETRIVDERRIRSSVGAVQVRPVITTDLQLGPLRFPIELTLADRSAMSHQMLLGRAALAGNAVIDCAQGHLLPHPSEV